MKREIQIYIEVSEGSENYQRIELFGNEDISINSSVQNISDLSKVFTDFTETFTVPCSAVNNSIFKHWYESDVDSSINHNYKRNAFIELDHTPFRSGKIQLESSSINSSMPEFYRLTFYGSLVSIKDQLGELKLKDLDYSSLTNPYDGEEIQDRIEDGATDYDVRYPLITSGRVWTYGDAASTDISMNIHRISYSELFPAVKVSKMIEFIGDLLDVTFTGTFLNTSRFKNCFLYCKNTDIPSTVLQNTKVDFISNSGSSSPFDLTNDTLRITAGTQTPIPGLNAVHKVYMLTWSNSAPSETFYVDIFKNGILYNTFTTSGTGNDLIIDLPEVPGMSDLFSFTVRCDVPIDLQFVFTYQVILNGSLFLEESADTAILSVSTNLDLAMAMPDMLVSDFFTGVLKEFNLTCYPTSIDVFQLEPLDDWYSKGAIRNITKYVDRKTIEIERVPLYKNIIFKHQKSESFMNRHFASFFNREYGDVSQAYNYDGGDYVVESPFENLLMQKFTGTNLEVGYCLTTAPDFKPYVPKPILLYKYDNQSCSFYFNDGLTTNHITSYVPFGAETKENNTVYSLGFSVEKSVLTGQQLTNNLFQTYYFSYLGNLFNPKTRLVKCIAIFPLSLTTKLKLNDRLVIRDKRYIINEIKTNLTTGQVDMVLINDFRTILNLVKPKQITKSSQTVSIPFLIPNGVKSLSLSSPVVGVTFSNSTLTQDEIVDVGIPANTDEGFTFETEDNYEQLTEDNFIERSENGNDIPIQIDIESEYENGDPNTIESIIITQEQ